MKFLLLAVLVAFASADDGQYRPELQNSGKYVHVTGPDGPNSGKYVHVVGPDGPNSGKYVHVVGPDGPNSGKYVHSEPKYHAPAPVVRVVPTAVPVPRIVVPQGPQGHWQTVRNLHEQDPAGDYHYEFETQNGIEVKEISQKIQPDSQDTKGFYQYQSPEGLNVHVDYVADVNGFQPSSDILPVAPPVPVAIQRALDYVLRNGH